MRHMERCVRCGATYEALPIADSGRTIPGSESAYCSETCQIYDECDKAERDECEMQEMYDEAARWGEDGR